jgi:hypothetical protein
MFLLTFPIYTVIVRYQTKSEAGRSKGLTLMLDAHSDMIEASSVPDDFQGFTAVIASRSQYPITSRKSVLIRPGHSVRINCGYELAASCETPKIWVHKLKYQSTEGGKLRY